MAVLVFGRVRREEPSVADSVARVIADAERRHRARCSIEIAASGNSAEFADWVAVEIEGRGADAAECVDWFSKQMARHRVAILSGLDAEAIARLKDVNPDPKR